MTVVKKFHRIILIFALLALLVFVINGVSAEDTANLNDISTVSADANSITLNHELNSSNSLYQNQVNMQDDLEDNNQLDSSQEKSSSDSASSNLQAIADKNKIYISPTGTSTATGTLNNPTDWATALSNVNANGIIYFKEGNYSIHNQVISKNLTLSSYNQSKVILNANKSGYFFYGMFPTNTLTIIGLSFVNGTGYQYSSYDHGGAIFTKGDLKIIDSSFFYNTANYGGAIFCNKTCIINGSAFINNSAGDGGAVCSGNQVYIYNSFFRKNVANYGGAIYSENIISSTNNYFYDNIASYFGGAIYDKGYGVFLSSYFENNTASSWSGGAIFVNEGCNIYNSLFVSNTASSYGGAIFSTVYCSVFGSSFHNNKANNWGGGAIRSGNLVINSSTFNNNSAVYGGAIFSINTSSKILNSTFTKNHALDAGAIYSSSENLNITSCTLSDNSATNHGGAVFGANTNFNITASVIFNNTGLIGKAVYSNSGNVLLNYNWWGNNTPFTGTNKSGLFYDGKISNYTNPNNWVLMSASLNNHSINAKSTAILTIALNTCLSKYGLILNVPSNLIIPSRLVKFSVVTGTFNPSSVKFSNSTTTTYTASSVAGIYSLYATIDNQTLNETLQIKANILQISTLSAYNLIETYGEHKNFTGKLLDSNNNPIVGRHIGVNLTRSSDKASKIYWVTTDINGDYFLEINLSPGNYTGSASFSGDNVYASSNSKVASITVYSANSTKTPTTLTADKFNHEYGAGYNFTGKLINSVSSSPIIGQHISINLTRLSNGLSKVYWVTTDINGEFQLAINLGVGEYSALCSYGGTSVYAGSSVSSSILVTKI